MCLTVDLVEDLGPAHIALDMKRVILLIVSRLTLPQRVCLSRQVLENLGVEQLESGGTCWCGEKIMVPEGNAQGQDRETTPARSLPPTADATGA